MKAVILISSIFYLLGLKISNQIDIFKKSPPVEKVMTQKVTPAQKGKAAYYKEEIKLKSESDSTKLGGVSDEEILKSK